MAKHRALEEAKRAAVEAFVSRIGATKLERPDFSTMEIDLALLFASVIDAAWDSARIAMLPGGSFTSHPKFDRNALMALWNANLVRPIVEDHDQVDDGKRLRDPRAVRWAVACESDYEMEIVKRALQARITTRCDGDDLSVIRLLRHITTWDVAAHVEDCARGYGITAKLGPKLFSSVDTTLDYFSPPKTAYLGELSVGHIVLGRAKRGLRPWEAAMYLPRELENKLNWARTKFQGEMTRRFPYPADRVPALSNRTFDRLFAQPLTRWTYCSAVEWGSVCLPEPVVTSAPPPEWRQILFRRPDDE